MEGREESLTNTRQKRRKQRKAESSQIMKCTDIVGTYIAVQVHCNITCDVMSTYCYYAIELLLVY